MLCHMYIHTWTSTTTTPHKNRHGKVIADIHAGYDNSNYIFRLFSQSKPVTAAATMILVDDGLIGLDDPVVRSYT